jgi:hypothetical protein
MGSIRKPGNSLTLEGKYCAGPWPHKADKTTEFLAVSAVAFNWADSYDAKVHCSIFRSKSIAHEKQGLATTTPNCCAHAPSSYSFQQSLSCMLVRDTDTDTHI